MRRSDQKLNFEGSDDGVEQSFGERDAAICGFNLHTYRCTDLEYFPLAYRCSFVLAHKAIKL